MTEKPIYVKQAHKEIERLEESDKRLAELKQMTEKDWKLTEDWEKENWCCAGLEDCIKNKALKELIPQLLASQKSSLKAKLLEGVEEEARGFEESIKFYLDVGDPLMADSLRSGLLAVLNVKSLIEKV